MIYRTQGEHTNHHATNAVAYNLMIKVNEMLPYMTLHDPIQDVVRCKCLILKQIFNRHVNSNLIVL